MAFQTLTSKLALVTGSTRGIGLCIATELIHAGWAVGINGKSGTQTEQVSKALGAKAFPVAFDVSDQDSVNSSLRNFSKRYGALDAVVNCAGVMRDSSLTTVTPELLQGVFDVNVFGSFYVLKASAKLMAKQRNGSIVLLSSVVGEDGSRGQTVYSASKGAVSALVKSAAKELAPLGIRVNGIAPGPIDTELFQVFDEVTRDTIVRQIPIGRIGQPRDIAPLAKFLVSEDSSFITGEIYRVDGGI